MVSIVELPIGIRRVVEGGSGDFWVNERVPDPILGVTDKLVGQLPHEHVGNYKNGDIYCIPGQGDSTKTDSGH